MQYDTSFMSPQIPDPPVYNQGSQMPVQQQGMQGMDEATRRRLAQMLLMYAQQQGGAGQGLPGSNAGSLAQGLSSGVGAGAGLYGMMGGGGGL